MTLRKKCPMLQFVNLGDNRGNLVVIEGGGLCHLIFAEFSISMSRILWLFEDNMLIENLNLC